MPLSAVEQQFAQEGFVVVRRLFSPAEVAQISAEFDHLLEQAAAVLAVGSQDVSAQIRSKLAEAGAFTSSTGLAHACVLWSEAGAKYAFNLRPYCDPHKAVERPSLQELAVTHVAFAGMESERLEQVGGGSNPRLLTLASALLGRAALKELREDSITQIILQAHFKAPGSGVAFPWHQDSKFRREAYGSFVDVTGWGSYVNIATAIDGEVGGGEHNGPLQVIPGSGLNGHLGGLEGLDPDTVDARTAICPLLQPGDALCVNPWIIHGSQPNESAQWRRSFVVGFAVPSAIRCESRRETESMAWFKQRPLPPEQVEDESCNGFGNWVWDEPTPPQL